MSSDEAFRQFPSQDNAQATTENASDSQIDDAASPSDATESSVKASILKPESSTRSSPYESNFFSSEFRESHKINLIDDSIRAVPIDVFPQCDPFICSYRVSMDGQVLGGMMSPSTVSNVRIAVCSALNKGTDEFDVYSSIEFTDWKDIKSEMQMSKDLHRFLIEYYVKYLLTGIALKSAEEPKAKDPKSIASDIRRLKTNEKNGSNFDRLDWNLLPEDEQALSKEYQYRTNLAGTDSSRKQIVASWREKCRDSIRNKSGLFGSTTLNNQGPQKSSGGLAI